MISCDEKALFFGPVQWVFTLIKKAYAIDLHSNPAYNVTVGIEPDSTIQVQNRFYVDLLENEKFEFEHHFNTSPLIVLDNGKPDYISSIFYLVNGFQEYNHPSKQADKYGRFEYKHSLQAKFNVVQTDIVKKYIEYVLAEIDPNLRLPQERSRIFVSHDIDSVYGSLKYDGLWALKSGNILKMMKVILQTASMNPPWFNVDKVANLESEYDIKACYYWIVKNGRDAYGAKNGDYSFENSKIQKQLNRVKELGNQIGLHKSTMNTSFGEELQVLPEAKSNRFHFLKIKNPDSFKEMEACHIQSDSSIGFPYTMGFKNSFGMPYYPYDLTQKKGHRVLEIPLHIMDGMFDVIDNESSEKAYQRIVDFIEANQNDAIISILWHNSEMTEFAYGSSFKCYKKLLRYFVESRMESVLPSQLVKEYEAR